MKTQEMKTSKNAFGSKDAKKITFVSAGLKEPKKESNGVAVAAATAPLNYLMYLIIL